MDVAELVPAVAVRAAADRSLEQVGARAASSSCRCDDSGSCQPVSRPSTARSPRSGVTTRLVQPSPAATVPSGAAQRLERADDGRADGDHAAAPAVDGVDEPGGRGRDAVPLGIRRLAVLGRRDAGVERHRRDRTPRATSAVTSSALNGRPALGISALPGSSAKTVW